MAELDDEKMLVLHQTLKALVVAVCTAIEPAARVRLATALQALATDGQLHPWTRAGLESLAKGALALAPTPKTPDH